MLQAILNKSRRQHPTKQLLYGPLPLIMKTINVRWTRHSGYCWRSKDKLISDILLWTLSHGWAKAGWPARTYIQQLCANTECRLEDLPGAMDNRDGWWERVREICAGSTTWWWWWHEISFWMLISLQCGGARGVMVIVVGNGHGDTSSNPGRTWLHFT